jgi:hypothetical protein
MDLVIEIEEPNGRRVTLRFGEWIESEVDEEDGDDPDTLSPRAHQPYRLYPGADE